MDSTEPKKALIQFSTGAGSAYLCYRVFRERIEAKQEFDGEDWGACGCFMDEEGAVDGFD